MHPTRRLLACFAALALAVGGAACGDDDPPDVARTGGDGGDEPAESEGPERIVSLSPTATETLFAIGAGDQVVAVDDQSTYPEEAPVTDLSGFQPNVEAIAAHEPDLVVITDDTGDLKAGIEALGAEVLVQPSPDQLEGAYDQIEELGEATGHTDEAVELVQDMKSQIDTLVEDLPDSVEGMTYYHELDQTFFAASSNTFIGDVYSVLGLQNIADEADDGTGFPQLSVEYIVEADPDLIFLADTKCCDQSAETVAERAGWDQLTAVTEDQVIELDDDIASRWGPRVVDFLEVVTDELAEVGEAS